jgi:hypothetical protein
VPWVAQATNPLDMTTTNMRKAIRRVVMARILLLIGEHETCHAARMPFARPGGPGSAEKPAVLPVGIHLTVAHCPGVRADKQPPVKSTILVGDQRGDFNHGKLEFLDEC